MPPAIAIETLRFGHIELHPVERQLFVQGRSVALGSRAFDVLLVLAQRHGRLVTKQELLDLVWPGVVVEEHNIATQIGNLRKLIGADAIATIAGRGYRLTAQPTADGALPAPLASPAVPEVGRLPRHNLPAQRTRFIGRDAALADLARLLPPTRLLTLTGIGGCGKTRLALQFAERQRAAFADGTWFVDLAPLQDPQRVLPVCAAVLGLNEEGATPLPQRLREHLATRHVLLVLDNCEHVLGAAAALVDALLGDGAGPTILATSREALGVPGEQLYPVRSLSLPATQDLAAVLAAESVRVFVDRARLALPDFEVDAVNAAPVAEICRRLDGIALAIELAAARTTVLSVAEIAQRLDDRFRLLTGGSRALPRHQTLQAAMEWSYEQLTGPEQRLLRQLSLFAGGWTLQAAAHLGQSADEYEALALLTALHAKSLLVVDREALNQRPRYRMLETVRQYAWVRLHAAGEAEAARSRFLAHFLTMAEEADRHVRGPEQDVWMGRFKDEHENLVVALSWCAQPSVDPQLGLRLVAATGYYWGWNSVELGYRLTHAVLQRDPAAPATPAREAALRAMARMSTFRGCHEESLAFAQQALDAAQGLGAPQPLALALSAVGTALSSLGRTEEALRFLEQGIALARHSGDGLVMFTLLNNVAPVRRRAGQLDAAERCLREALALARLHAGRVGTVVVLDNLIRVLVARRKLDQARAFALECLPLARREKVAIDLVEVVAGLASSVDDHVTAARFWGASEQKMHEWGYRSEPDELEHSAPLIERSRRALGEAAFEVAGAGGRGLGFDDVMRELERWLLPTP